MDHSFDVYSDTFKDVNGFRPRGRLADRFLNASAETQAEMLDSLFDEIAEQIKEDRKAMMHATPVDPRSPLEIALAADDSPEHAIPLQRRKARRYGRPAAEEAAVDTGWERLLNCGCVGCNGRTWKRFRKTQYRAVKAG